ncbi:MAG: amidohydrolase family protein, partial [Chitinophagaceae bacterium]
MHKYSFLLALGLFFWACNSDSNNKKDSSTGSLPETSSTIYYGGDIITMEGDSAQYAESVVVKDGKISFVGGKEDAMKAAGEGHQMVDIQGKTLVPGFIDGHAHFFAFGSQAICANLLASPDGNCNSIDELI